MLDTDTKRRIDTARDILVGKVPDPKSQVEQITIALIYKFMDDMDADSEEMGGVRTFFAGEFSRYGWAKLLQKGLGGHEALALYSDGISRMPENPGVPPLFRDIFKNAYLPYRDPETLKAFLKIIDEFKYDHSERLGDAFEYLLSVLGSQGDAGQFRTPRHIIDFLVQVINPQKHETILDPACGTAGFLISAWKHIQAQNQSNGHSNLTPDERGRLARNIKGYDISPDMVRLSLANLYLHGFTDPHVVEYDTLTSEERWNEHADVILANPPFMSPKGGIKPHKRFSVQSKRSEVLFVDYMAEHLTPNGRAGIIVPEGIIFQSQGSYKELRKMLVENSLVAVISLPAGVFQPYSGVKTSILVLDRSIAKQSDSVAFFKVENDGFGLGAQRRSIEKDDLPTVRAEIAEFLRRLRARVSLEGYSPTTGQIVLKEKVAENGDYNLSVDRYRNEEIRTSIHRLVPIGEICDLQNGRAFKPEEWQTAESGGLPIIRIQNLNSPNKEFNYFVGEVSERNIVNPGELLFSWSGSRGTSFGAHIWNGEKAVLNQHIFKVLFDEQVVTKQFLLHALNKAVEEVEENLHGGVGLVHITKGNLERICIPLPPLDVQKEIVGEIEGYQKVIDGARQVVDNYRPYIAVDPEWPKTNLDHVIDELETGVSVNSTSRNAVAGEVGILKTSCVTMGNFIPEEHKTVLVEELNRVRCPVRGNTIIISRMNTEALVGANAYVKNDHPNLYLPDRLWQTVISRSDVDVRYLQTLLASPDYRDRISSLCGGTSGSMKNITKPQLLSLEIPLPPFHIQQAIVTEIEAEQALVNANKELIARFEKKIQSVLDRVWGSSQSAGEAT